MPQHITRFSVRRILLGSVAIVALAAGGLLWQGGMGQHGHPAMAAPSGAVPVSVQTVQAQPVRLWSSFSGRLKAVDYAEIRPEVTGRIVDIRFRDGQIVKAGEILLVIDPKPYEAAVAKAEADLASAKVKAEFAKIELERAKTLVKTEAIAQRVFDQRQNDHDVAQAEIKAAEAEVLRTRVDLDHAFVKAPITGRVSRAELTLGNLVMAGLNAPLLTTIVSNNGIYADFEVDEQTYLRSIHALSSTSSDEHAIPVEFTVAGDDQHPYRGTIYSFDNHIDTGTGTIRARAKFANGDGALVPGMFVAVRLASSRDDKVLLVDERAIGTDQNKKFVYVVNGDNKVVYREIVLGQPAGDGRRVVQSGLEPGERVITDGLQHVRPDALVQIKNAALDGPASSKMAEK